MALQSEREDLETERRAFEGKCNNENAESTDDNESRDVEAEEAQLARISELEEEVSTEERRLGYAPIRQRLGVTLLAGGKSVEAGTAFRADLARYPNNGWSLFGLHKALLAQAKTDEAASVKQKFKAAWRRADVQLTLDVLY